MVHRGCTAHRSLAVHEPVFASRARLPSPSAPASCESDTRPLPTTTVVTPCTLLNQLATHYSCAIKTDSAAVVPATSCRPRGDADGSWIHSQCAEAEACCLCRCRRRLLTPHNTGRLNPGAGRRVSTKIYIYRTVLTDLITQTVHRHSRSDCRPVDAISRSRPIVRAASRQRPHSRSK